MFSGVDVVERPVADVIGAVSCQETRPVAGHDHGVFESDDPAHCEVADRARDGLQRWRKH